MKIVNAAILLGFTLSVGCGGKDALIDEWLEATEQAQQERLCCGYDMQSCYAEVALSAAQKDCIRGSFANDPNPESTEAVLRCQTDAAHRMSMCVDNTEREICTYDDVACFNKYHDDEDDCPEFFPELQEKLDLCD